MVAIAVAAVASLTTVAMPRRRGETFSCAHQPRSIGGVPEFARRRFQPLRQRVPVQMNDPLRLTAPHPHRETLYRHDELQRLDPLDRDPHRILAGEIMQLSRVFALDRLTPLLLTLSSRIAFGQLEQALRRLTMEVVMERIEPLLIAVEPVEFFLSMLEREELQVGKTCCIEIFENTLSCADPLRTPDYREVIAENAGKTVLRHHISGRNCVRAAD
jgi:hypothetical protein